MQNEADAEQQKNLFYQSLSSIDNDVSLTDFCRKHVLHGTPYVFNKREDAFYDFRKKVADKFEVSFHEIYITGSGKLGFSPFKNKLFDLDSDIDIAIISNNLFEKIMSDISNFQMQYRKSRWSVREDELKMYHEFLEYTALGWIRPDKLPVSFQLITLKNDWFTFFNSLSYGRSEVGNYKVSAGVFKSYSHLENYIVSGLQSVKNSIANKKFKKEK